MDRPHPDLSVVVASSGGGAIRKIIEHLSAQTVRDRLEIVLAVASADSIDGSTATLGHFSQVRILEMGLAATGQGIKLSIVQGGVNVKLKK